MYENAYNYDGGEEKEKPLESHLIKNSEWGAVAYLTHSKYGRNGTEVEINDNGEICYTGGTQDLSTIYDSAVNGKAKQSSTGNATGIYDLSGNATERYSRI